MQENCVATLDQEQAWLRGESTPEHDIMFCDYCVKAGVSSDKCNFVRGCIPNVIGINYMP